MALTVTILLCLAGLVSSKRLPGFMIKKALDVPDGELTEKDFETLANNLVVLQFKIDEGFTQTGDPIKIAGMEHYATLTTYRKGDQCFQHLFLKLFVEMTWWDHGVKLSCCIKVNNPNMTETGIKIGGVLTELPYGEFLFVVEGGICVKRTYSLFTGDIVDKNLDPTECDKFTGTTIEKRKLGIFEKTANNGTLNTKCSGEVPITKEEGGPTAMIEDKPSAASLSGMRGTAERDEEQGSVKPKMTGDSESATGTAPLNRR